MVERLVDGCEFGGGDVAASARDAQRGGELACGAVGAAEQVGAVEAVARGAPGGLGAALGLAQRANDLLVGELALAGHRPLLELKIGRIHRLVFRSQVNKWLASVGSTVAPAMRSWPIVHFIFALMKR